MRNRVEGGLLPSSTEEGEAWRDAQVGLDEGAGAMCRMWVDIEPTTHAEGVRLGLDDAVAPLPSGVAWVMCEEVASSRTPDTLRKGDPQRADEVVPVEVT